MPVPPLDYTLPPTPAHVETLLRGTLYWPPDTEPEQQAAAQLQAQINVSGAVAEFERRTGWHPFVASSEPADANETRWFDAADAYGVLDLDAGLLELASVTLGGQTLVENTSFWLQPANAMRSGRAYTTLKFAGYAFGGQVWTRPNRIAVSGLWGRFRTWPADAWQAVLRYAAVQTLTTVNQEQDIAGWSEDGFSESRDIVGTITPGQHLLREWPKEMENAVMRYKRVVC